MATTCQRVYFLLACHLAMLMSSIVAHAAMLIVLVSPGLLQTCLNIHGLRSPSSPPVELVLVLADEVCEELVNLARW